MPSNFVTKADEAIKAVDKAAQPKTTKGNASFQQKLKSTESKLSKINKANVASRIAASRSMIEKLKLGTTKNISEDLYVFIAANPGGKKVGTGFVAPSKGMSGGKSGAAQMNAEKVLEDMRRKISPNSISRVNSVYLSPYSDAGAWKDWGSNVFVVKIPKGSKITYADGAVASEVNASIRNMNPPEGIRPDSKEDVIEWAELYWQGRDSGIRGEEIITKAKVEVIGKVEEVLDKNTIEALSERIDHY